MTGITCISETHVERMNRGTACRILLLLIALLCPAYLAAQQNCLGQMPAVQGGLSHDAAVAWANCISSQVPVPEVAQQTIVLGTFELLPGGAARMVWRPNAGAYGFYACGTTGGGYVQLNPPICLGGANSFSSFNVQYQIFISKPAGYDLQVTLSNPLVNGGSEIIAATVTEPNQPGTQPGGCTEQGCAQQCGPYSDVQKVQWQACVQKCMSACRNTTSTPRAERPGVILGPTPAQAVGLATLTFHPHLLAQQRLTFMHSGQALANCLYETDQSGRPTGPQLPCSLTLVPSLQPQLGAFEVDYLPVGVIYQPPGSESTAGFTQSTSIGTTLCWGTSSTQGTSQIKDASLFFGVNNPDSVENGIAQLASAVGGIAGNNPVGTTANVIGGVLSALDSLFHIQTTRNTTQTQGQTVCKGSQISLSQGYTTDAAHGDRYILLTNVLFLYVVVPLDPRSGLVAPANGIPTVILTMLSAEPNAPSMADLKDTANGYPADLIQQFQSLDLQLNPRLLNAAISAAGTAATPNNPAAFNIAPGGPKSRPMRRLKLLQSPDSAQASLDPACYYDHDNQVGWRSDYYTSADVSSATTTATTTKVSGFLASITGKAKDTTQSFTLSSNQTNWTTYGTQTLLILQCPEINPPYRRWIMSYYLDTLFGTLIAVPGQKSTSENPENIMGAAAPQSMVTLHIGSTSYTARADAQGEFAFHIAPSLKGRAVIVANGRSLSFDYTGVPLANLRLTAGTPASAGPSVGGDKRNSAASANSTACCQIEAINQRVGIVLARVNASGRTFQFKVRNAALLHSLKTGQAVWANFGTRQVSLNGSEPCCSIVSYSP